MAFETEIADAAYLNSVPVEWVRAVIDVESGGDPLAYRWEDKLQEASFGLMQLLESTARGLGFTGDANELFDPAVNIELGAELLRQLREKYGDDFRRVYSAYNSGRPDLWQTSQQVARNVSRALAALEKYATGAIDDATGAIEQNPGGGLFAAGVVVFLFIAAMKRR